MELFSNEMITGGGAVVAMSLMWVGRLHQKINAQEQDIAEIKLAIIRMDERTNRGQVKLQRAMGRVEGLIRQNIGGLDAG